MSSHPSGRPLVLVDMDGVLTDFEGAFWDRWAHRHPHAPQRAQADTTQFLLSDQLPAPWKQAAWDVVLADDFFAALPPMPDAIDALHAMTDAGWDVRLCTAPLLDNPTCADQKLAWLARHLGPGWDRRAVITKDKTLVRGDVLIDDKPTITGALTPTWVHVMFDAPYNQDRPAAARLHGWTTWRDTLTPLLHRPLDQAA